MMTNQTNSNFLSPITDAVKFYKDYLGFLIELEKRQGGFAQFKAFNELVFLVSDPSLIEEILIKKTDHFKKGTGYERGKIILGEGLLTSDFELHDKQRPLIMPALSKRQLFRYEKIINEETEKLLNLLPKDEYIDFHVYANELFLRIISRALFSDDETEELIQTGIEFNKVFYDYGLFLLAFPNITLKLPLPAVRKFKKLLSRLDEIVYDIIDKRKDNDKDDLLGYIMNCRYENGEKMSRQQIRDEAVTLFFASHDTSARTLSWTMYLLTQNEDVKFNLAEQTMEGFIQVNEFEKLNYIKWCIMESLRIYPPAHSISRIAVKDFQSGKFKIRKGASVLVLPYILHRKAEYYEEPMKYNPLRWKDTSPRKTTYLPFGAGNRYCIGDGFAIFQLTVALNAICRKFNFELKPGEVITESASLTLKPKYGIKIKFNEK